jgi:hypothetical protein
MFPRATHIFPAQFLSGANISSLPEDNIWVWVPLRYYLTLCASSLCHFTVICLCASSLFSVCANLLSRALPVPVHFSLPVPLYCHVPLVPPDWHVTTVTVPQATPQSLALHVPLPATYIVFWYSLLPQLGAPLHPDSHFTQRHTSPVTDTYVLSPVRNSLQPSSETWGHITVLTRVSIWPHHTLVTLKIH